MTDEPNIKNDDRLAGGGEWLDDAANTLRNVEEPETADALLAGVAALRQRCSDLSDLSKELAAAVRSHEKARTAYNKASWLDPDEPAYQRLNSQRINAATRLNRAVAAIDAALAHDAQDKT